jgi:hypothetical protein
MFQKLIAVLTLACTFSATLSAPVRREVPQEHSHNQFLATVRASLSTNNPDAIEDPVFGLLGDAAAAAGAGKITDVDCLQQATADQAFTNAKAANDVNGQVAALIYRALERNTGKVGLASVACTSIKAVNPEIAAIQQHQDPASTNAAATNKAIVLALAQQIAAVGGDPQDALKSGTFQPGSLSDDTGKGNTCDTADDTLGCIFSQNLLVDDATAAEITAAVGGAAAPAAAPATAPAASAAVEIASTASTDAPIATAPAASASAKAKKVKKVKKAKATTAAAAAAAAPTELVATATAASGNLQKFTGALGGSVAPPVTAGGRGFVVAGESDSFLNLAAATGRSCDVQHNACADIANSAAGSAEGLSVGQCDTQDTQCKAAN